MIVLVVCNAAHSGCNYINGRAYGDCSGVQINTKSKGYIRVSSIIYESGIIDGATIKKGGELHLSGMSNGDIYVFRGGRLRITGMVSGAIYNQGGVVEVEGMASWIYNEKGLVSVSGMVDGISGKGRVKYNKGAVIGGSPVTKYDQ